MWTQKQCRKKLFQALKKEITDYVKSQNDKSFQGQGTSNSCGFGHIGKVLIAQMKTLRFH